MSEPLVRLGFDVGERRTGMAKSIGDVVVATEVIEAHSTDELLQKIIQAAKDESAQEIIIGLPLDGDYSETEQSGKVRALVATLKPQLKLPLFFANEFLSTIVSGRDTLPTDDDNEQAARTILEQYLREGGQPI